MLSKFIHVMHVVKMEKKTPITRPPTGRRASGRRG